MSETCGIIPPRQRDVVGYRMDGYMPECIRPRHMMQPHLFRTPEGKYCAWEDDNECGCCEPEESDPCYVVWEMSAEEANKLIEERD